MPYLIMRDRITGHVFTKDYACSSLDEDRKKALRYNRLFGHRYDVCIGDFTEPYTDDQYLKSLSDWDYIPYTETTGRRVKVDKYGQSTVSYPQWRLHALRDNQAVSFVTDKQWQLKEMCERAGMDIGRIKWFTHFASEGMFWWI